MGVPEQGVAVLRPDALQFPFQLVVIRPPVPLAPRGHLALARQLAGQVNDRPRNRVDRYEARRVLARVEIGVVRRPVQIDHVPRMRRDEHRSAEIVEEVVETVDVPVGVGQRDRRLGEPGANLRRDVGAGVRHRDEQRARAAAETEEVHQRASGTDGSSPGTKRWNAPASTSRRIASMSGAK